MSLERTLGIILAGGVGSRLYPLTHDRAKPSVPFAGKYRIIDFTLSNCYHSGLKRILVLTQYKSHSLQLHLRDGWSIYNPSIGEYITPVPPQMRTGASWYAGTADAVYQNLYLLERNNADQVLILSGDHIYRMDYAAMMQSHCENLADVTVASMKVPLSEASAFGVMQVDASGRVEGFQEKPIQPAAIPGDPHHALASLGIYIFSKQLLCDVLSDDSQRPGSSHDFGKDILPRLILTHEVYSHDFDRARGRVSKDGYWRDVGTIDAYYAANMDLLEPNPPLDLYQADWPIRTLERQSPPARTFNGPTGMCAEVDNAMICCGTTIGGATVRHSILSRDVVAQEGALVEDAILFDGVVVGPRAHLRNCIVDKGVKVPADETVGYDAQLDAQRFTISETGVVVVPKLYRFPSTPTKVPSPPKLAKAAATLRVP
jgi:glucose-1-phosphate adenylyltransferase